MTQSSRLAAHRARASAEDRKPDPTNHEIEPADDDESEDENRKDKQMTDATAQAAAIEAARTEATSAANKRFSAVLASEHYAGRETLAQTLLANDKLSADEITGALAVAPKAEANLANTDTAAEEAARAEMKAAIEETGNSAIDAGGAGSKTKGEDKGAIWDRAIARVA